MSQGGPLRVFSSLSNWPPQLQVFLPPLCFIIFLLLATAWSVIYILFTVSSQHPQSSYGDPYSTSSSQCCLHLSSFRLLTLVPSIYFLSAYRIPLLVLLSPSYPLSWISAQLIGILCQIPFFQSINQVPINVYWWGFELQGAESTPDSAHPVIWQEEIQGIFKRHEQWLQHLCFLHMANFKLLRESVL